MLTHKGTQRIETERLILRPFKLSDANDMFKNWASDDEVTKMLDIKLIRENPDKIKAGLKAKEVDCDELIDRILELDEQRRTLLQQTEALKAEQNKVSKQIPALKKAGEDTTAIFKEWVRSKARFPRWTDS